MSDELVVPDLTEPIIGWRRWFVRFDEATEEPYLASGIGLGVRWPMREALGAQCLNDPFGMGVTPDGARQTLPPPCIDPPRPSCRCGVYACSYRPKRPPRDRHKQLTGKVALWGRVVRHERGYRAQYGYPLTLGLRVSNIRSEVLRSLLDGYGCELDECSAIQWRLDL